ncbi:MAG: hypothetical protein A2Y12_16980 [Planctomycetes bacterium GWF2_42_9]|nr:MAG: hypothetical protein A2Y12_16980 [Planctomycetes bacterium GWF2_42_9]
MSGTIKVTAETSKENLPNDTDTLKEMVLTLLGQIDDLQGQLYYLKRQLFGKKSEKLNPAQRLLFENLYDEVKAKLEQQKQEKQEIVKKPKNENHNGRNPLPAELPRETTEIMPQPKEQTCEICNTPKEIIGSEKNRKTRIQTCVFLC